MKCYGLGRLVKDPEVRVSQDGKTSICKFTLACNRRFKKEGQPDADFISCIAFGKVAEFIEKYFSKGMKMFVEQGSWQTGSFTDKDGNKVYTNTLLVESVDFCESKAQPSGDGFVPSAEAIEAEELPFL